MNWKTVQRSSAGRCSMPMFKIIATIEVTTEAEDHDEAQMIGMDCLDWSNADIQVLEEEDEDEDDEA